MSTSTSRTSQQRAEHVNMNNTPVSQRQSRPVNKWQSEQVNKWQSEQVNASNTSSLHTEQNSHTAICKICDACYRPAPSRRDLLQGGPDALEALDALDALEAAFMSMCHFCFRCRRPACPACWDRVHRVCAECVQEAHLSFRTDVSPLQGTLFPVTASSIGQTTTDNSIAPLLICVRAGRFQQGEPPVVATAIATEQAVPAVTIPQAQTSGQPEQEQLEFSSFNPNFNPRSQETSAVPTKNTDVPSQGTKLSFLKTIERVLNVVLFSLLVLIIILVLVAELSPGANAWFMGLLHVDIRGEVAYILYVIRQFHW